MRCAWLVPILLTGCVQRVVVDLDAQGGQTDDGGELSTTGTTDPPDESSSEGGLDDSGMPDPVELDTIYVNSSDTLFTFVPQTGALSRVGTFVLDDGSASSVTDIAIDRFGLLYAISAGTLYVCDPNTVVCSPLGRSSANSAGFAEFGSISSDHDVLILVEGSDVVQVHLLGDEVVSETIGSLREYSSSGDVMPLSGSLMLLASPDPAGDGDVLVAFDAATADLVGPIAKLPQLTYGLAGYGGQVWAFTDFGQIFYLDEAGEAVEVGQVETRLWGAATHPDSR